jgi:hypothetical protein
MSVTARPGRGDEFFFVRPDWKPLVFSLPICISCGLLGEALSESLNVINHYLAYL